MTVSLCFKVATAGPELPGASFPLGTIGQPPASTMARYFCAASSVRLAVSAVKVGCGSFERDKDLPGAGFRAGVVGAWFRAWWLWSGAGRRTEPCLFVELLCWSGPFSDRRLIGLQEGFDRAWIEILRKRHARKQRRPGNDAGPPAENEPSLQREHDGYSHLLKHVSGKHVPQRPKAHIVSRRIAV